MSAPEIPSQPDQRFDRERFRTLLGMYILGLALGFVFLGIVVSARYRAAMGARQQQQQALQQQQQGAQQQQQSQQAQPPSSAP